MAGPLGVGIAVAAGMCRYRVSERQFESVSARQGAGSVIDGAVKIIWFERISKCLERQALCPRRDM